MAKTSAARDFSSSLAVALLTSVYHTIPAIASRAACTHRGVQHAVRVAEERPSCEVAEIAAAGNDTPSGTLTLLAAINHTVAAGASRATRAADGVITTGRVAGQQTACELIEYATLLDSAPITVITQLSPADFTVAAVAPLFRDAEEGVELAAYTGKVTSKETKVSAGSYGSPLRAVAFLASLHLIITAFSVSTAQRTAAAAIHAAFIGIFDVVAAMFRCEVEWDNKDAVTPFLLTEQTDIVYGITLEVVRLINSEPELMAFVIFEPFIILTGQPDRQPFIIFILLDLKLFPGHYSPIIIIIIKEREEIACHARFCVLCQNADSEPVAFKIDFGIADNRAGIVQFRCLWRLFVNVVFCAFGRLVIVPIS